MNGKDWPMVLRYLIEKEFKQMLRNRVLPAVFVVLPLAMMQMVPRVASQEVKNLKLAVVDHDHTTLSARLTQKLGASTFFRLEAVPESYKEAVKMVDTNHADIVVEIARGFGKHLEGSGGGSDVMVVANGVNGVKSALGTSYIQQILAGYSRELRHERGVEGANKGLQMKPRFLFNTRLDYKPYMIPALLALLLVITVGFLPALNIVMEKEKGTIEQINVTPVGRADFILSKLIPYWAVGLSVTFYGLALGGLIYGVWPAGGLWGITLATTLFILVVSSLGLIVSNFSDTLQQAALTMFFFVVIFVLMSGMISPVQSMPAWAKAVAAANPLYYFIDLMRVLYLKGSAVAEARAPLLALCAFIAALWPVAIFSYRKRD